MNRVLSYLESIYQIARVSCEEYSPELLSRIDHKYNEIKNVLEKGDKYWIEDYSFEQMVNLFRDLNIDYRIYERTFGTNYKMIIQYKDYDEKIIQLFYDENGKFISKWRG